jgi:tetratricopeptide (TPR) repeat protein
MWSSGGVPLTAAFQDLRQGQPDLALQRLYAAKAGIGADLKSEWWRMVALAESHQGQFDQAFSAYAQAFQVVRPENRARLYLSYGALLGQLERRDEAIQAYASGLHAARAQRDDAEIVTLTYNLGWSLLQVMQVDRAARVFEEALLSAERSGGRPYRPLLFQGRSTAARLRGALPLALATARWGLQLSEEEQQRVRSQQKVAECLVHLGQAAPAAALLDSALGSAAVARHEQLQSLLRTHRLTALGDWPVLEAALPSLMPADRWRAWLHLAAQALRAGDQAAAHRWLGTALAGGISPYVLHSEAGLLENLYGWGRAQGQALPHPPSAPPPTVEVKVRGALQLTVNGVRVACALSPASAAAALYLMQHGETGAARLQRHALGAGTLKAVVTAAARLRLWTGDPEAVQERVHAGQLHFRLGEHWSWTADQSGTGRLLEGLDSPFTQELNPA